MTWSIGHGLSRTNAIGRAFGFLWTMVAAITLGACAVSRPTGAPVRTIFDAVPATGGPKALLVIMPGMRDTPEDIVRYGFVRAVRERGIAADIVIADTHFGYFRERSFEARLRSDIIEPARTGGYTSVWLSGISLGGFGSLLYASRNPLDVHGLIVLAPFIAREGVASEVLSAGGLTHWMPPPVVKEHDFERRLLSWLKGYQEQGSPRPPLYLGYGATDRFAPINGAVGDLLPRERRHVVPGGHTWASWITLWEQLLDRAPLPRIAARAESVAQGKCRTEAVAGCVVGGSN